MKKVLLVGGSGFIARYVAYNLLARDITPMLFDRHLPSNIPSQKPVEFYLGDVANPDSVSEAVALCDGVIHLAGVLGTSETIDNPLPALTTNIYGSLNVFQAIRQYQKKAVYISVGNYWMNNSYSITKTTAEKFAWMFNKEHGTEIAVVRALNAYGAGQKHKPVRKIIPNFILPALRDEEITVYGDGSQIMDMVHASDVADVLVRALLEDHGQYVYTPLQDVDNSPKFDIGTGRETTVQEIAELVIEMVGSGSIKNVPMRAGEPENSVVLGDPTTLKPLYNGKVPELITLEEGLESTIEYYRGIVNDL